MGQQQQQQLSHNSSHNSSTNINHQYQQHQPLNTTSSSSSEWSIRLSRILNEKDHEICTKENKSLLLSEGLATLRMLTKEIQEVDWKYNNNNSNSNNNNYYFQEAKENVFEY